jgi:hypothetical protein
VILFLLGVVVGLLAFPLVVAGVFWQWVFGGTLPLLRR